MPTMPEHTCSEDRPCPVLIGICEGPDPSKWKMPCMNDAYIRRLEAVLANIPMTADGYGR